MSLIDIKNTASRIGLKFLENVPMSTLSSFRTGGNADMVVFPCSVDQIGSIIKACKDNNVKSYIIGNGSNILVSDNGLSGVVVRLSNEFSSVKLIDETTIVAESGASMKKLCAFALENGLSGLEFAYGIPGTAGGAAYMNAGAYGGEMKDILIRCDHIDESGNEGFFENDELKLGYRESAYSNSSLVITRLYLRLKKADREEIRFLMDTNMAKRRDKQPLEYPSAGSTFKRPKDNYAGKLIEDCGLKGCSVGGAQVSVKHAGFVINTGNATTAQIRELIKHIQDVVFNETGVMLEREVKYLD